jgi:hypothetical protein
MAITLVTDGGPGGFNGTSPVTQSIPAAAGQTVVVTGLLFSTSSNSLITGVSDNAGGNTWVVPVSIGQNPPMQQAQVPASGGYTVVFVAWCLSLVNNITSLTISNASGLDDFWRMSFSVWQNVVAADSGASNLYASTSAPSSTVNLFDSGDLVVGVSNDDVASYTGSPSGGGGWADFTGAGTKPNVGYIFPGSAGNYTATWTLSAADVAANAVQAFSAVPITPPPPVNVPGVLYSMRSFP